MELQTSQDRLRHLLNKLIRFAFHFNIWHFQVHIYNQYKDYSAHNIYIEPALLYSLKF